MLTVNALKSPLRAFRRLRAERRCGQLLKEMDKAKGGNRTGSNQHQEKVEPVARFDQFQKDQPKTLADMGLTKDQSSTYQKLADVPEEKMEDLPKHSLNRY